MNPLNWYPKKRFTFRHILDPPGQPIISKLVPGMLSISVHWNKSRDNGESDILDHRIRLLDAENKVQQVHQGKRNNYLVVEIWGETELMLKFCNLEMWSATARRRMLLFQRSREVSLNIFF